MSQLRISAIAAACLVAMSATDRAQAADPGRRRAPPADEPAPYAVAYNWQGLYYGASIGAGWGTSTHDYDRNDNHGTAQDDLSGALGSLTVGYNWMVSPGTILGVEGDLGLIDVSAGDKEIFDGHLWKSRVGPFWGTLRARAGFLLTPSLLVYGTGGLAFAQFDEYALGDAPGQSAYNENFKFGWALGTGAELAISQNMTAKIEYLHMDFGRYDGLSENRERFYFENTVDVVRAGINVKL